MVVFPKTLEAQFICITGKIADRATGESMRQVSVVEQHTGIGTISSEYGFFSLCLKPGMVELVFSDGRYVEVSSGFELSRDTVMQVLMDPRDPESLKRFRRETGGADHFQAVAVKHQGKKKQ